MLCCLGGNGWTGSREELTCLWVPGVGIWIDSARILAQSDCWVSCMKLHIANQTEIECKLRYNAMRVYGWLGIHSPVADDLYAT